MINVARTIISQYSTAPTLTQMIADWDACIDPRPDFANFYNIVWNIDTAVGFGLDIWGRILGVSRLMQIDDPGPTFGFDGSARQPFEQGTFGDHDAYKAYLLSDSAYRALLLLKALVNISACDARTLNGFLSSLLGDTGRCYVLEVAPMRIRYVFEFSLTPYQRALFANANVTPRPGGVGYETYEIDPSDTFGFDGSGLLPFGQGVFDNGGILNVN